MDPVSTLIFLKKEFFYGFYDDLGFGGITCPCKNKREYWNKGLRLVYYYLLSAIGGCFNFIILFCYFRRKIPKRLYFRLGHTETARRLGSKSPLGKYLFAGLEKHISPVWRFMNVLLPLAGLASIACGIVGFELKSRAVALAGLVLSSDLILLSFWLMLLDALFLHLDKKIQLELQKFSVVVFFTLPFLIFSLKLFG